jgi:transcriptional regulator with XRE-family HTH domain
MFRCFDHRWRHWWTIREHSWRRAYSRRQIVGREMRLGNLIRKARERLMLTQQELAAEVGISPQYLCDIETGRRDAKRTETLDRLAFALNLEQDVVYIAAGLFPYDVAETSLDDMRLIAQCINRMV